MRADTKYGWPFVRAYAGLQLTAVLYPRLHSETPQLRQPE